MAVQLYPHQAEAIPKIQNGSILRGGTGSGKTITALYYYISVVCGGSLEPSTNHIISLKQQPPLYIITTADKRNSNDWIKEAGLFKLTSNITVDSWNNIKKYKEVKKAFFIFDEQKVVGKGTWSKTFISLAKHNQWILLSATPGDNWNDYVPLFLAHGFYKNRTQFNNTHVVFSRHTKYPQIDRYINTRALDYYKHKITVPMEFQRHTIERNIMVEVPYDKVLYNLTKSKRWNYITDEPIEDIAGVNLLLQQIVNSSPSRIEKVLELIKQHGKVIIFYTYNYELAILQQLCDDNNIFYAEKNGHKHEPVPDLDKWVYLVQYISGAEAWNCITCDTIIFYSHTYSYKMHVQAKGRIDRLNTPFTYMYYYHMTSNSSIDKAKQKSLRSKKNFNEKKFIA